MLAQELLNLFEVLNLNIDVTKQLYDENTLFSGKEYEVLFKERQQLKEDIQVEIAKLKEFRNQIEAIQKHS
jgi:hypothetical protein